MITSLIVWIIVGAVAGWLAGYAMTRNTAFNLMDVILGMVGSLVGGWLGSRMLGTSLEGISIMSILWAFIGAIIVAFAYKMITGRSAQ